MQIRPRDPDEARALPLGGAVNSRDLGGLPVAGGGRTRFGVAIRSDAPRSLDGADAERLRALGLSTVVDLRQPNERERDGSPLATHGLDVHEVDVWGTLQATGWVPADPWDLNEFYLALLDHAGASFAEVVRRLTHADGAALFHCTVGKDRTGLVAALLLESVGVPRDAVIIDYVQTDERIGSVRERLLRDAVARGVRAADFERLLGAEATVIERALGHLDARHGGAPAYLARHGVGDATLARLVERLVDDDHRHVP